MISNLFRRIPAFTIFIILSVTAKAQYTPVFTQYMFNETYINPAYAGSRGVLSATFLHRSQWVGFDGAPTTQTLNANAPLLGKKMGLGLSILNEKIGVTQRLAASLSYAYRIATGEKSAFAFGLQAGVISLQEKFAQLKTTDPNDKQFAGNLPNTIVPNFGFGVYYNTERFYTGLSIPALLKNNLNFTDKKAKLKNDIHVADWHYYLTGGYVFDVSDKVKLKPTIMLRAVQGAPLAGDASVLVLFKDVFWIGAGYRTGNSMSLITLLQVNKQFRIGYAYDYTLNAFSQFNSGSHEITIGYDFSFSTARVITPRYF